MTTEKTQEEAAKLRQEKLKALEATLGNIEKSFGKGSIMRLGAEAEKMESISTGSIGLDYALGVGGLPKGRIIEIYGPESSGKTTLALHVVAEAQKKGGIAAFIDARTHLRPEPGADRESDPYRYGSRVQRRTMRRTLQRFYQGR